MIGDVFEILGSQNLDSANEKTIPIKKQKTSPKKFEKSSSEYCNSRMPRWRNESGI